MTDRNNAIADELRTCSELDPLLLDELASLLNEPVASQSTSWTRSSLLGLCQTVDREFHPDKNDVYLAAVLEEFPNWDSRVETLRQQRDQLGQRLQIMIRELADQNEEDRLLRHWRDTFRQWILEYSQHRRAERDLLQEAVTTDVGVAD